MIKWIIVGLYIKLVWLVLNIFVLVRKYYTKTSLVDIIKSTTI